MSYVKKSSMHKVITLEKTNIQATLKKIRRAKHMRIILHQDGRVVVTAPMYVSYTKMQTYLYEHEEWLRTKMAQTTPPKIVPTEQEYQQLKEQARAFVHERLAYWNQWYQYAYKRVSIRKSRTRWGSCSSAGNLNFSYTLALLPQELADYVIVHELCHLQEMNHSPSFWKLVSHTMPNYKLLRKALKQQSW